LKIAPFLIGSMLLASSALAQVTPSYLVLLPRVASAAELPTCNSTRENYIYALTSPPRELRLCKAGSWISIGTGGGGGIDEEADPVFGAAPAASITDAGSGVVISSAERSKLAGIEAGATADQTAAEVSVSPAVEGQATVQAVLAALSSGLDGTSPLVHTHAASDVVSGILGLARLPVADSGESSATELVRADDGRLSDARAPASHTHPASDVTTTLAAAQLPAATTSAQGAVIFATSGEATALEAVQGSDSRLSDARTPTSHTHPSSDISTALSAGQLPAATTSAQGASVLSTDGESSAGEVVQATDARLSNARTPTAHVHDGADVSTGTVVAARLPSSTTSAAGIVTLSTSGESTSGEVVTATDSRLTDARTPVAHNHAGEDVTTGTVAVARLPAASTSGAGVVTLATGGEVAAGEAVQANDSRLSDSRAPTAHVSTHQENGSDELLAENLGTSALSAGQGIISDGAGGMVAADLCQDDGTNCPASASVDIADLVTAGGAGKTIVTNSSSGVDLVNALQIDTVPPSSPAVNDFWLDTSTASTPKLCVFHASLGWIEADGSGAACAAAILRTLTVSLTGSGGGTVTSAPSGINCAGDCTEQYSDGSTVDLTATADGSSVFSAWSNCATSVSNPLTVLMDADKTCTASFAATSGGSPAADWSTGYTLYYDFDVATVGSLLSADKIMVNQGTAGSTCDLRQYGSNLPMAVSTSVKQQGLASMAIASVGTGVNQRLGVRMETDAANGACDVARTGNVGADYGTFTYIARVHMLANDEGTISNVTQIANGGPGGWGIEWGEIAQTMSGRFYNGSTATTIVSGNNACPASSWCVVGLVFNDSTDQACMYVNGALSGSCQTVTTVTEPGTGASSYYRFGFATASSKMNGYADESGLMLGSAYTAQQMCRACSCGIDGSLCTCDSGDATLYQAGGGNGLNASQCGSCALPACNASAP
jgi:hypothetical protein